MRNTQKINHKNGFTLLELMVVIAIIGILNAVAIPGYLSWRSKHQMNRAVTEYVNLLQRAKMTAIKDRATCKVSFSANGYELACQNSSFAKKVDLSGARGQVILKKPDGSPGVPMVSITFNSRGLSNSAYLYFSDRENKRCHRVGPLISGAIKNDYWTGNGWKSI